jgi:CheY-like chemotaxis protein
MKILVADDEAEVRETVGDYLTLHGHEVLAAANGLEALLHVKHARPDAVVLDLGMPRLGGIDALKRIRVFDPSIGVVVVTAAVDEAVHRQASALGARAVLSKPVALPDLLAALGGAAGLQAASSESIAASVPASTPRDAGSATRVLVIDDDDGVRDVLAEFLTGRGYDVSQAARAAAGTRVLADTAPDVVLLDIDMPGLSGADALPTIRAMAPRAVVIMVSGTADEAVAKRTLAYGAFDYLVKPIDFDYLVKSIETALAMRALES